MSTPLKAASMSSSVPGLCFFALEGEHELIPFDVAAVIDVNALESSFHVFFSSRFAKELPSFLVLNEVQFTASVSIELVERFTHFSLCFSFGRISWLSSDAAKHSNDISQAFCKGGFHRLPLLSSPGLSGIERSVPVCNASELPSHGFQENIHVQFRESIVFDGSLELMHINEAGFVHVNLVERISKLFTARFEAQIPPRFREFLEREAAISGVVVFVESVSQMLVKDFGGDEV